MKALGVQFHTRCELTNKKLYATQPLTLMTPVLTLPILLLRKLALMCRQAKEPLKTACYAVWYGVNPYMWHQQPLEKYHHAVHKNAGDKFRKNIIENTDLTAKVN